MRERNRSTRRRAEAARSARRGVPEVAQTDPRPTSENLERALVKAHEQQAATSEILKLIGRSTADIQQVFDAVVENALKLCRADFAFLDRIEGEMGRRVAVAGEVSEHDRQLVGQAVRQTRENFGRVVIERRTIHVPDIAEYPEAPPSVRGKVHQTILGVPLLRDGVAIGVFGLWRFRVEPFTEQEIELVTSFADQAVIAIENVRLFHETKEALEQRTAVAEILDVISRSAFDIQPVLETVIEKAVSLCGADNGTLMLREDDVYRRVAHAGTMVDRDTFAAKAARQTLQPGRESLTGRVVLERASVQIADLDADPEYQGWSMKTMAETRALIGDVHAMLGVPLLRNNEIVGVIVLRRFAPGPFAPKQVALVETFAAQAVIALENVRLFNETKEKSAQLEAASRHKSEFLANMSHELRTPLNAIIGFSEVLLARMFGELNERQREYLEDIRSSGQHQLTLINEVLDLSKVEAGRMELELGTFELSLAIEEALALVRERAGRSGVQISAEVPADLGRIEADERKVKQVLLNLLANAVKFTPQGGWVGVVAKRLDGEVQVSVRDTGIGIAAEDQARVFEEFQQLGRGPERAREGTGLGLALSRRFVELHGGRIWLESEAGKGSTFTFALPVRAATREAAPA